MIKVGFKYRVKYVKDRETRSGSITEFQIGDKIKPATPESESPGYWNMRVTVWGGLTVSDGDTIVIDSIQSIEAREYQGKTFHDMTATCHVDGAQTPKPTPPPVDDSDISLPFDL